jgi:hypothetical protein
MKTIQVSDEDYEFLKDCVNELKTQDNRSTRSPIYTIWKTQKRYGVDKDYTSDIEYIWDGDTFESLEEIIKYLDENEYDKELLQLLNTIYYDSDDSDKVFTEWNDEAKAELNAYVEEGTYDSDIEDFLNEKFDIYSVGITTEDVQVTDGACFSFFEKDALEHLQNNRHNIKSKKAYTYADSLYRSPRMEKLLTMLNNLKLE